MAPSIAAVEIIPVYPKLAARYAHRHADYWTIDHRDFYKVSPGRHFHSTLSLAAIA